MPVALNINYPAVGNGWRKKVQITGASCELKTYSSNNFFKCFSHFQNNKTERTSMDLNPPPPISRSIISPILPILNFLTELGPEGSNGFCRNLDKKIFFEDFQNFFSFSPKRPFFKVTENPEKCSGTTKSSAINRTTFLVPILCLFVSTYAPSA